MLRHQLAFCREHRDVLQEGELRPLYPHQLYPLVVAKNQCKLLAAFYSALPLRLDEEIPEQLILVNGSYQPVLLLDLVRPMGLCRVTVTSCTGELIADTEMNLGIGLHRIAVPAAAHANVLRMGCHLRQAYNGRGVRGHQASGSAHELSGITAPDGLVTYRTVVVNCVRPLAVNSLERQGIPPLFTL